VLEGAGTGRDSSHADPPDCPRPAGLPDAGGMHGGV